MGLISQKSNRDSTALLIFRKGLDFLNKNQSEPAFELEFLSDMILSSLRTGNKEESDTLLKRYNVLLNKLEEESEVAELTYPLAWYSLLRYIYYMDLNTQTENLETARLYQQKVREEGKESMNRVLQLIYLKVEALYYRKAKQEQAALATIDRALEIERNVDMLKMKVDVLRALGQLQKAIPLYEEVLTKSDSIDNTAFTRQIGQLRLLNDLNNQEKEANFLQSKKEQIAVRQHLLIFFLILSLALLVLLSVLFHLYRRTHRLQKELRSEKDSLVESEQQLRSIKERAVEANRLKSAFISNISHEVRTPLNAIVGFSELLTEEEFAEEEKKAFASTINHSSELLLNLINDVLEVSRLESGKAVFSFKPTELTDCCHKVMASVEHRLSPGVCLQFHSSAPDFELTTDALRLQQLLGHLLFNAVKFTTQGKIILAYETDDEMQVVRFSVTDTGCGIRPEMQQKIFERFEKLDEFMQGTGLGLSICKIISDRFHGSIFLDTTYTEGARFIFIHPYHVPVK